MAERLPTWLGDTISDEIHALTTWLHQRGIKQEPESQETQRFELAGTILKVKSVTGQSRWVFVTLWPHPRKPQCSLADSSTPIVAKFGLQALNVLNIPSCKAGALVNLIDFEINVNVALEGDRQIQLIINRCEIPSSGKAIVPTYLQPIQERTRVINMLRRLRKVQQVGHQHSGSDSDLEEIEPEDFTASKRLPKPSQSGPPTSRSSNQATKLLGALNQKSGASRPAAFNATRLFEHFGVAQPVPTRTQSQSVGFMTQHPQPVISSRASDILSQGPAQPSEQIAQQTLDSLGGVEAQKEEEEEDGEEHDTLEENSGPTQLPDPIEHHATALTEDAENAEHKSDGQMDLTSDEGLANETTQDISLAQPLATRVLYSTDEQRMPHPLYWKSAQSGVPHNQMRTLDHGSVWVDGKNPISLAVVPQEILDEHLATGATKDVDVDSSYESSSEAGQELPSPEPDSSAPLPWSQSPPRQFALPADLLPPNSSGEPSIMLPSTILDDRENRDKYQDESQDEHQEEDQDENQAEGIDQDIHDLDADQHPDVGKDENNDNVQAKLSDESIQPNDDDWFDDAGFFKASQPSPLQPNPSQPNPSQPNPSQPSLSQPNVSTARESPQMNSVEVEPTLATTNKDAARLSLLNSSRHYGSTYPEPSPFLRTTTTRHGMFKTSPLIVSSSAAANFDVPKPLRMEVAETPYQSSAAAANNGQERTLSPVSKAKDKEHKKRRTSRFEWSQSSDEAEEDPHVVLGKRKHEFFKDAPRASKTQKLLQPSRPLQPSQLSRLSQLLQPLEDPHIAYAKRRQEHLRSARQLQQPVVAIGVINLTERSDEEMDGPAIETVTRSSDLEVVDGRITAYNEKQSPLLKAQPHSVHADVLSKKANQPLSISKAAPIHPDRAAMIHATTPEGFRQQKLAQKTAKKKEIETQITKDVTEELYSSAKAVSTLPPSNASSAGPTGSGSVSGSNFDRFSGERLKEMIEFEEPKRSFDWLTGVCESDPSSYLTQVEICQGYTKAFDSGKGLLDNKQLLNVVTLLFEGTSLTNLDINLNEKIGVVQGLRVKKTPPENVSSGSGNGSATPPVMASGSVKRKQAHKGSPSTQRGKGRKVLPRDAPQGSNKSSTSLRGGHFDVVQTAPKGALSGPRAMRNSETRPVPQGPANLAPSSGEPRQGGQRVVNPLPSQHQQQQQRAQRPHNADANLEKPDEDTNSTDIQLAAKGSEKSEEHQGQILRRIADRVAESKTLRSSWHISRFDEFYTTYSMIGKSGGNAWANNDQRGMEQDTVGTVNALGWGPC